MRVLAGNKSWLARGLNPLDLDSEPEQAHRFATFLSEWVGGWAEREGGWRERRGGGGKGKDSLMGMAGFEMSRCWIGVGWEATHWLRFGIG
jgi:hypothetical protein